MKPKPLEITDAPYRSNLYWAIVAVQTNSLIATKGLHSGKIAVPLFEDADDATDLMQGSLAAKGYKPGELAMIQLTLHQAFNCIRVETRHAFGRRPDGVYIADSQEPLKLQNFIGL